MHQPVLDSRPLPQRRVWQLLCFLLFLSGLFSQPALAQSTGIFEGFVILNLNNGGNNTYDLNPSTQTAAFDFVGPSLGTLLPGQALVFSGGQLKTFKNSGCNVLNARLYYRVYLTSSGSTAPFVQVNLPFDTNLSSTGDQRWTQTANATNIAAGLAPGVYTLEVYGDSEYDQCGTGTNFYSNSNANYKASFTVAGTALCGTAYTIDPAGTGATNFQSFAGAFAALNANGVSCGTTFNVRDNVVFPENNVQLNAVTGTSATARVTFQRDNSTASGANVRPVVRPNVIASGSGGGQDAIIKLSGADFITFDGIDVSDANNASVSAVRQMEYGYALFRPSPTDGCQNIIIRNCAVTLNKTNSGSIGIFSSNANISGTVQTTTSAAGANSENEFDGNTISNAYWGVSLLGNATAGSFPDLNNRIGSTVGNSISNIGGMISADVYGVRAEYQSGLRIEGNTVTIPTGNTTANLRGIATGIGSASTGIRGTLLIGGNTVTIASGTTGAVRGIHQAAGSAVGNVNITNNRVQNSALTGGTGEVAWIEEASSNGTTPQTTTLTGNVVTGNRTATSGIVRGIFRSGTQSAATTVSSNQVTNNLNSAASQFYGIQVASAAAGSTPIAVSSNTISGNQLTGAAGQLFGVNVNNGTITFGSNILTNNTIPNAIGASEVNGYFQNGTTVPSETLTDNVVTGLSIGGAGTGHGVRGFSFLGGTTSTVQTILRNVIGNLSIGGSASGSISGIVLGNGGGTGTRIARNKVYDLSAAGESGTVIGIFQISGNTFTYSNNLLGDFRAPAASTTNAVVGLFLIGGTAANVYFNTIYLNASSTGADFGTSGIFLRTTTPLVSLRNNIVANLSTPNGVGVTATLRRNAPNATNSSFTTDTNNNLYWAGTPSATNAIFTDGTVTAQDLTAYKLLLTPRESNSFTENPPFISTDGTSPDFLHIKLNFGTQIESGGQPIAGITDDYDGTVRNATAPDLGADEGTFRLGPPLPVVLAHFAAVRQNQAAELTWATASEQDSRGFEVQASPDGLVFHPLGFVAGAGNSSARRSYAFTDRSVGGARLRYYRLRLVDLDGTASFSPVRAVAFGVPGKPAVSAAPNPFDGGFAVAVHARAAQPGTPLTLTDAAGRVVRRLVLEVPAGTSQLPVTGLANLPAGLYLAHLLVDGQPVSLKVIKQ